MKRLLLVRHGETPYNVDDRLVGGQSNWLPLTEKGLEQPNRVARFLLQSDMLPDYFYSSRAVRANHTAQIIVSRLGLRQRITIDDRLLEMSQGIAEGKPRIEVWDEQTRHAAEAGGMDFKLPGAESPREVADRMYSFVADWANNASEDTITLAATHGMAKKWLMTKLKGVTRDEALALHTPNCSVTSISDTPQGLTVDYFAKDVQQA